MLKIIALYDIISAIGSVVSSPYPVATAEMLFI